MQPLKDGILNECRSLTMLNDGQGLTQVNDEPLTINDAILNDVKRRSALNKAAPNNVDIQRY